MILRLFIDNVRGPAYLFPHVITEFQLAFVNRKPPRKRFGLI